MFEEFLSDAECDGLKRAHEKYVDMWSKKDPILCFNGIQKLREHLIHAGKGHINVSPLDFTEGMSPFIMLSAVPLINSLAASFMKTEHFSEAAVV